MFESKINRGRANGYAPLDGSGKVPLDKLPPIQSTIDTGSLVTINQTGSFATIGSNTFTGVQTITGNNGRLIYRGTALETYPTLAEIHTNNDYPWIERFHNDTFSTSSAVMAYFGYNDGRFVFHNESTQSIGLQVNGYSGENGLLVYSDKVAFVNNVEISDSLIVSSTIVNNANVDLSGSNLIIDGGDIILSGSMYFGSGSSISETSSSIIITPAGAAAGQSLVVRQTGIANLYSDHPSGFYSGDTITLTYSPNNTSVVSGSAPYIFTGCTQEQLGTSLSGSLIYNEESTKTLTWTIPALSDISGFTFEIYNFVFFVSQSISLSSSGSSEQSHIHLVSGDPSLVDIYLGDDDQYVKIEKNAGDVVIGTNLDTHHWRFDTSGSLTTPGNIIVSGSVNINPLPQVSIGQDLQGGKVAYILQSGDVGYDTSLIKGIIAAEADEANSTWYDATASIDIKTTNGYTDWYLPSVSELRNLYINRVAIGGFSSSSMSRYWSSTEWMYDVNSVEQIIFEDGIQPSEYKTAPYYPSRAIRQFSIPKESVLNVNDNVTVNGNIVLSGSFAQQVNYAPFGSGSFEVASTDVTQLDITKDIHLLDVTGEAGNLHWFLPNGLYDGQVVRFALKGDGTTNPNDIYIWMNNLRAYDGTIHSDTNWSPFWDNGSNSPRSLATILYIDGAWNIDTNYWGEW